MKLGFSGGRDAGLFGAGREASERCGRVRSHSHLATDPAKCALFDRLASHLTMLADQVEMATGTKERHEVSRRSWPSFLVRLIAGHCWTEVYRSRARVAAIP